MMIPVNGVRYEGDVHYHSYSGLLPLCYVLRAKLMNDEWYSTLSQLDIDSCLTSDKKYVVTYSTGKLKLSDDYMPIRINEHLHDHMKLILSEHITESSSLIAYLIQFLVPNRLTVSLNDMEMFQGSLNYV